MVDATFKKMTKHSSLKVGTFMVEFNTPGIGQILRRQAVNMFLLIWSIVALALAM